jgi:hypothetical protein
LATIQQRIGQLKKSSHGIGRRYEITVVADETGKPPRLPGQGTRSPTKWKLLDAVTWKLFNADRQCSR